MRREVEAQLESFLEACKLSLTCPSQLAVNMVIQIIFDATTISLSAHQLILMVCHIYTDSLLSSKHKHRCTSQALLSKQAMPGQDRINLSSMVDMRQLTAMPGRLRNQFRGWYQASH